MIANLGYTGAQIDDAIGKILGRPSGGAVDGDPNGVVPGDKGDMRWDDDKGILWIKRAHADPTQNWLALIDLGWVNGSPP